VHRQIRGGGRGSVPVREVTAQGEKILSEEVKSELFSKRSAESEGDRRPGETRGGEEAVFAKKSLENRSGVKER